MIRTSSPLPSITTHPPRMNRLRFFIPLLLLLGTLHRSRAQDLSTGLYIPAPSAELPLFENGFIYDAATMAALRRLADSAHRSCAGCAVATPMRAPYQGRATYVKLFADNMEYAQVALLEDARLLMVAGEPPEKVLALCDTLIEDRLENSLVVMRLAEGRYRVKEGKPGSRNAVDFRFPTIEYGTEERFLEVRGDTTYHRPPRKGEWVIREEVDRFRYGTQLEAVYFAGDMESPSLPSAYGAMVDYAACLTDTIPVRITLDADRSRWDYHDRLMASIVWTVLQHGEKKRMEAEKLYAELRIDTSVARRIDTTLIDSLIRCATYDDVEGLVGRHLGPVHALALMRRKEYAERNTTMWDGPFLRSRTFAVYAAATGEWSIALRAHLDLVSDRSGRFIEFSSPYYGRSSYIAELEALPIDLLPLLIGTVLAVESPSPHRDIGVIARIGKALAEMRNRDAVDSTLQAMVADDALDPYNRQRMARLHHHVRLARAGEKALK